jgi:DNA modification methylase
MTSPASFHNGRVILHAGDCLDVLDAMEENSVDAVVTDPPYELGFMGKKWDGTGIAFRPETWAKVLHVLKPGGHLVAFNGTRSIWRMGVAIEDAGFEIRDTLAWLYGTGFPKSLDVSKAIDKAAGVEREVVGFNSTAYRPNRINRGLVNSSSGGGFQADNGATITAPATDAAREWQGWGTAIKPAFEPICLARKPLSEPTVAANVLRWGTGALNIDACRIESQEDLVRPSIMREDNVVLGRGLGCGTQHQPSGRFPANVITDGSDEVVAGFPESDASLTGGKPTPRKIGASTPICGVRSLVAHGDSGSASRFFYSAKADATDRAFSKHPTVKPVSLMRWLVRLVTPPGGTVLDVFAGTGTSAHAALLEGFNAILIERESEYRADIARRMSLVFAGEVERAKHAKTEAHDSLPLFLGAAE